MPIDASIPLGIRYPQIDDPLTARTKQAQLSELMGRQQLQQLQLQGAQREQQDQMTMADLWRESGGDPSKMTQLLAQRGQGARIPAFQEGQAKIAKLNTENDAAKLKLAKEKLQATQSVISSVASLPNPTHQDAIAGIMQLQRAGFLSPEEGAAEVRALPSRQEMLKPYMIQLGLQGASEDKRLTALLGEIEIRNMGGSDQAFRKNLFTGEVTPGASYAKTATPGEVMTDARTRAEGAANRGVQMRGQNMTAETAQQAQGKPPAGYRLKPDGSLEAIPGGPADQKTGSPAQKVQDATEAIQLINQAEPLLKGATGSYSGVALDTLGQAFGIATPGAINAQQLKAIEGMLVSKMPKMSGPQSDKDVLLYRQMAGQIGDPTIPYQQKAAALNQVREIQERYAGMQPGSSKPVAKPPANPSQPTMPLTPGNGWSIKRVP